MFSLGASELLPPKEDSILWNRERERERERFSAMPVKL